MPPLLFISLSDVMCTVEIYYTERKKTVVLKYLQSSVVWKRTFLGYIPAENRNLTYCHSDNDNLCD